ncbi:hypothetical protein KFU94_27480 [Chloroflexi bacterium TSY]|nr:hypothetical protein [Chloroflexi bacterium TSY]
MFSISHQRILLLGLTVAYSLTDYYRPIRMIFRLNGFIIGLGVGAFLLIFPRNLMIGWGLQVAGPAWPARIAGSVLIALGCLFVASAGQRIIHVPILLSAVMSNGLIAIVLLLSYLQREFAELSITGQAVLIVVFLLCLITAVLPLRYIRADYPSS